MLFTIVVDTVGCIVAVIIGNILAAGITIQWAKSGFSLSKLNGQRLFPLILGVGFVVGGFFIANYFDHGKAFLIGVLFGIVLGMLHLRDAKRKEINEKAISDLTKNIELNPSDEYFYQMRGCIYYRMRNYEKAIADFTKAIELNPKDALSYGGRSVSYIHLRRVQSKEEIARRIADLEKAVELDPNLSGKFKKGMDLSSHFKSRDE